MSLKYHNNCWADRLDSRDFTYITDLEQNIFLVFDHERQCLRLYKDDPNSKNAEEVKPIKIVQVNYLPKTGIEAILAHPLMTKRYYPYLVVKANDKVSVIHTRGIINAAETDDYEQSEYVNPRVRNPLLVLHFDPQNNMKRMKKRKLQAFGCIERDQVWYLWHNVCEIPNC